MHRLRMPILPQLPHLDRRRHPLALLPRRLPRPLLRLLFAPILAPLVLRNVVQHDLRGDPTDEEEPERVHRLERDEQGEGDGLRDPAFVLLLRPVEVKGPDRPEFSERCVDDEEIEVVPAVGPDAHEEEEVRPCEGVREVVEEFAGLGQVLAELI